MLKRRDFLGLPVFSVLGLAGCATTPGEAPSNEVPPFSGAGAGPLPDGWAPYVLRRDLPPTEYRLAALARRQVLRASGTGVSSGLRCNVQLDPRQRPWISWHWQVDHVPSGMCVAHNDTDDSPARVVVACDGDHADLPLRDRAFFDLAELLTGQRLPYATLMYVWDAQLPVGTIVSYARTSRIRYLVVESGAAHARQWRGYRRDLRADLQAAFGEVPQRVSSVGVLTDSDDLQVPVDTWYGDIRMLADQPIQIPSLAMA